MITRSPLVKSLLRPSLLLCLEGRSQRSARPPIKVETAMDGMVSNLTDGGEGAWGIREVVKAEVEPLDAVTSLWCAGIVGNRATLRCGAALQEEGVWDTQVVARMKGSQRGVSTMEGERKRLLLTL